MELDSALHDLTVHLDGAPVFREPSMPLIATSRVPSGRPAGMRAAELLAGLVLGRCGSAVHPHPCLDERTGERREASVGTFIRVHSSLVRDGAPGGHAGPRGPPGSQRP